MKMKHHRNELANQSSRPGLLVRPGQPWWPGCDIIFISPVVILKHEMAPQADDLVIMLKYLPIM